MDARRRVFAAGFGLFWLGFAALVATAGTASAAAEVDEATIYVSSSSAGVVDGISFTAGDILAYDGSVDRWSMFYDSSVAGLGSANVDGFHIVSSDPGSSDILLSFSGTSNVPGLGRVDDSDVVRYRGSTGTAPTGTFEMHLDGSHVGLTSGGEDLDAVAGRGSDLLLSVLGAASVPALDGSTVAAVDEDLLSFVGTTGSPTTGGFEMLFDGSDTGFRADLVAAWFDPDTSEIYGASLNGFSVPGLSGDGDDIFVFTGTTGDPTSGAFTLFFDGDDHRFGREQIDALHVAPGQITPTGEADLGIAISDDVTAGVVAGETVTFVVDVTNAGPDTASNVVVTGPLPAGLTLARTIGCAQDPGGLPCSLGDVLAGQSVSFEIEATVGDDVLGEITTTVSVAAGVVDPDQTDDTASIDTLIAGPPRAADDGPDTNSVPGDRYHVESNGLLDVAGPGLLDNDVLGSPVGAVVSFGGGDLGGSVTDNAAEATASVGDGSLVVTEDGGYRFEPPSGYEGPFTFEYRLANEGGSSDAMVTIYIGERPTAAGGDLIYISTARAGTVDGVVFDDEDIIVYDTAADTWSMVFDGSDLGLRTADIDAFHVEAVGEQAVIHLSLTAPRSLPGAGPVDDSDVATFTGITGSDTSGTFRLLLDNSDMNLSSGGEDVDALWTDGDVAVLSTLGSFNAGGGLVGGDEDLLDLVIGTTGPATTGVLSLLFDGSDVDLQTEDVTAASLDATTGEIYTSILGPFSVPGLTGDGDDVITFTGTTGRDTAGTWSTFFDGDAHRFGGHQIDGVHVTRPASEPSGGDVREPVYAEGWHLDPPEIFFDGDGQTATVRLVQRGPDGEATGATPPAGISLIRPNPTFAVTESGPGVYEITGSETIGSEPVGFEIPGETEPLLLWVTSYRVRDDVVVVPSSDVVFPPPGDSTVDTVAPFTLAELQARFDAGSQTSNATIPFILRGQAPPVGTKLSGLEVYGVVVEPSGLPSIERDGLALVSLEQVPVTDIFAEAILDVDLEQLSDAGLGAADADDLQPLDSSTADESARPAADEPLLSADDQPESNDGCTTSINAQVGQNNIVLENNFNFIGELTGTVLTDPATGESFTDGFKLEAGVKGTGKIGFEGNIQLSGEVKVECPLTKPLTLGVPVPGIWGLLDLIVDLKLVGGASAAATATDIGFDYKAVCTVAIDTSAGVTYSTVGGGGVINNLASPSINCGESGVGVRNSSSAAEGGIKFFGNIVAESGFLVGGKVTQALARLLQNDDLGKFRPFVLQAGPSLDLTIENGLNAVTNKANKTGVALSLNGEAGLNDGDLQKILKKFKISLALPLLKVTYATALGDLISPPNPNPFVQYRVDGIPQESDKGVVGIDEQLSVSIRKPSFAVLSELADNFYVYETTTGVPVLDTLFTFTKTSSGATTNFTMTEELCQTTFVDKRTYSLLGYFGPLGPIEEAVPAYMGEFEVECDQSLQFSVRGFVDRRVQRSEIVSEVHLHPGRTSETIELVQSGFDNKSWEVLDIGAGGPPYLSIAPASGTFPGSGDGSFVIELNCGDDPDEPHGSTFYQARANGSLQPAKLDVTYDCSPNWIEAEADYTAPGGQVVIRSEGTEDDQWRALDGRNPGAIPALTPVARDMLGGELYTIDAAARDPRPRPKCGEMQQSETRDVLITTATRGTDSLQVVLPHRDPPAGEPGDDGEDEECDEEDEDYGPPDDDEEEEDDTPPGPPGGPAGDPHMRSFDGLLYDAQVLGEYEYATSLDGSIRLVGRHENSSDGPTQAFGATSATALSLEVGSVKIEAYARPSGTEIRVNGNVVELPEGLSVDAGGGIALTKNVRAITVDAPGMYVTILSRGGGNLVPHLNVQAYPYADVPVFGMLGSNDGDGSNDLTGRDGTVISLTEARAHDTAFYGFTDSWRITDPALSPFTLPSSVFDDPNEPRPTSEELAPYRAQALNLLGAATTMCSGDFQAGEYIVDVLAIELAIGTAISDLSEYTCNYEVTGRVTTTSPTGGALGVGGARVRVDADGLLPCVATAAPDGSYVCPTSPDFDEVGDGSGISFPFGFDITVEAPEGDTTVASASGSFTTPPVFGSTVRSADNDLTVAPGDLTIVDLSGTVSIFGEPRTEATGFDISYEGAAGVDLGSRTRAIDPDATGAYRAAFVVPETTDEVLIVWDKGIGGEARPSVTLTGLGAGVNARTFDASYDPPVAVVSGTAIINGSIPDQILVTVEATRAGGAILVRDVVAQPDETTGAYVVDRVLPNDTISFVVTVEILGEQLISRSATVDPAVAGQNPVTLDLDANLPALAVMGIALDNGVPVTDTTGFTVEATTAGGSVVSTTTEVDPAPDGSYAFGLQLPEDTTSVEVFAAVGPNPADHPSIQLPTVEAGPNVLDFDFDAAYPVLQITGTLTSGGAPFTQDVPIRVTATTPQAFDETFLANPIGDGSYSLTVELPGGTTTADLIAELGFDQDDHVTATATGLVPGDNPVGFDASFDAVVLDLTGTLTDRGTPVTGLVTLDLKPFDVIGNPLPMQTETVAPDATGAYSTRIYLPDATTEVLISAGIGALTEGRLNQMFDGLGAGLNPIAYSHDHNPPVLDITGAFTGGGAPLAGLYDIVAVASFTNEFGFADTFEVRDEVFLSIIDGSYSLELLLPEVATSADLSAEIGADPLFFPTLVVDPTEPGQNTVDFSADLTQDVDVQLNVMLSFGGAPFSDQTEIVYRSFDESDAQIGAEQQVTVDPGTGGTDSVSIELSPNARRIEVAWIITDGPAFQSFDVVPGQNVVDYTADIPNVELNLSGTLTDGGAPFTDPTQIRINARVSAIGSVVETEIIDVFPDANGEYQLTRIYPPTVNVVEVRWLDAFAANFTLFDVQPGVNDILFDDDVGTFGDQTFELTGTVTIGGDPWPEDFRITLRPRRLSGSSFAVQNTVTPDPTTGAYTVTYEATQPITEVRAFGEGFDETFVMELSGTTSASIDVVLPGRHVATSGTVTDGGNPATDAILVIADGSDPLNRVFRFPTLDQNGDYQAAFRFFGDVDAALLGVTTDAFDDDVRFLPDPVALNSGATTLTDVDLDITAPVLDVSGSLISNGSPVTDPVTFDITWTDDEPDVRSTWTSQVEATPDASGDYSFSAAGPLRADRATVVAVVPAPLDDRSVEVAPLSPGSNPATLSVTFGTSEVVVSGTMLDKGQPAAAGPYPLAVTAFDGGGSDLGTLSVDVTPDAGDGSYSATVALPDSAAEATLQVDLTEYDYMTTEPNPFLVFTSATGPLDADGSTDVTFDVSTTYLEVTGVVSTTDGTVREDEFFSYTVQALDGTTELAVVEVAEAYTDFQTGAYTVGVHLPTSTDNAVVQLDFAGAAPIVVAGIAPGLTTQTADVTTDPFQSLTVTGRLAVDGANATGFVDYDLRGYTVDPTVGGHQLRENWFASPDFTYSGTDGSGSATVPVPPEVDVVEFSFRAPPEFVTYRKVLDLRSGSSPFTMNVDVDATADRVTVLGTAAVAGDPAVGPCAREGEVFLFNATITGFTGDPADAGTPPGTVLLDGLVVPSIDPVSVDGVVRNFDVAAPAPTGITHVQVAYATAGVEDPVDAVLNVTRDAVPYAGGALDIVDNLTAGCGL